MSLLERSLRWLHRKEPPTESFPFITHFTFFTHSSSSETVPVTHSLPAPAVCECPESRVAAFFSHCCFLEHPTHSRCTINACQMTTYVKKTHGNSPPERPVRSESRTTCVVCRVQRKMKCRTSCFKVLRISNSDSRAFSQAWNPSEQLHRVTHP